MITLTRIKECNNSEYKFIENLLTQTFPNDEYRHLNEQRKYTQEKQNFHLMLAKEHNKYIGFVSYWTFEDFCYIEHLAIDRTIRGKGYGSEIITQLKAKHSKIVLEAELPENNISIKRIEFYKRLGFSPCSKKYIQPAYRQESNEVSMILMDYNCNLEANFERVKTVIHKEVYGITNHK